MDFVLSEKAKQTDLFPDGSAEDLILRGYSQEEIQGWTGVDPGYHNQNFRGILTGIDRDAYKAKHISVRIGTLIVEGVLSDISNGNNSNTYVLGVLSLGVPAKINIGSIFGHLGLGDAYQKAKRDGQRAVMQSGAVTKFGTNNVFNLPEFQQKAAKTREERYGAAYTLQSGSVLAEGARETINGHMADPAFAEKVVRKRKQTTLEHYGVEVSSQSDVVKEKIRQTNLERYGCHPNQREEVRERMRQYMLVHGAEIRAKARATMLEKYGVENYWQTDAAKAAQSQIMRLECEERNRKARETCLERYGTEYYSQTEEERVRNSQFMKEHSEEIQWKVIRTNMERYGVPFPAMREVQRQWRSQRMSDPEYQKHLAEVRKKNGTSNTSQVEEDVYVKLCQMFGEDDVVRQYYDERYPTACDFYIRSRDLFLEVNGTWTHHSHWYMSMPDKDAALLKKWQNGSQAGKAYYDNAIETWTVRDVAKRRSAAEAELNYIVFWTNNLKDMNLWVSAGCPDGKDWEREYSWVPDK